MDYKVFYGFGDRRRSNDPKLQQRRFRLGIRETFLTLRLVKQRNGLPREAV